jgi:hypothetical protein
MITSPTFRIGKSFGLADSEEIIIPSYLIVAVQLLNLQKMPKLAKSFFEAL